MPIEELPPTTQAQILLVLRDHPRIYASEIARRAGQKFQDTYSHLNRLREKELVVWQRQRRASGAEQRTSRNGPIPRLYSLSDRGRQLLPIVEAVLAFTP